MGVVFAVYDRLDDREVALKRLTASVDQLDFASKSGDENSESGTLIALVNEFRTLASLRHPNIISVLDYGLDNGSPYIAMELLNNAYPINQAAQKLNMVEKINLIIQLLQALIYLHRHGIVHRDLKPDNVPVTANGTVKVLDFGVATTQHIKGQITGTIAYMAPKILESGIASVASDLFAVGIIMYQIFAGHHPFEAENTMKMIQNPVVCNPDFTRVPQPMQEVVSQLLIKSINDRLPSAEAVLERLFEVTDNSYHYTRTQ